MACKIWWLARYTWANQFLSLNLFLNVLLSFVKVNIKRKSIHPILTFFTVANCHFLQRWPKSHWQNNFPSHYQATMIKMRNLYAYKKEKKTENGSHINPYEYLKIHKNKIGRILKSASMVFFTVQWRVCPCPKRGLA